jgi:hypothetical protein
MIHFDVNICLKLELISKSIKVCVRVGLWTLPHLEFRATE